MTRPGRHSASASARLPRVSPRVKALLSLGIVASLATTGTWAAWSDSATVSGTTISTGTLDLKVGTTVGNAADSLSTFTTMNQAMLLPGSTTAGVLTVVNAGTTAFTYSTDAVASNADGKGLGAAFVVKVTGAGAVTGSGPTATCAGASLAGTGTAFTADFVSSSAPRQLAAGASETLCIQATLPASASNALQGATTDVTFNFAANQLP